VVGGDEIEAVASASITTTVGDLTLDFTGGGAGGLDLAANADLTAKVRGGWSLLACVWALLVCWCVGLLARVGIV